MAGRNAAGESPRELSAHIHLRGQVLPDRMEARSWSALCGWLASSEFAAIADRVDFITINNHAE